MSHGAQSTPTHTADLQQTDSTAEVTFPVTGMTCASCVRRIEKRLGKVEGVQDASVNLATEKARVVFDPAVASVGDLVAAVEKAGYGVGEMPAAAPAPQPAGGGDDGHTASLMADEPLARPLPGSVVHVPATPRPASRRARKTATSGSGSARSTI